MDVRRAVLDAALEVISTEGPDAVSMRDVARRAGVSHQAPYHHFGDRSGIFAAISEEGFQFLTEAILAASASPGPRPRLAFEAYLRTALGHPGHFRVMFHSGLNGVITHEATHQAADDAYDALLRMVEVIVGVHGDDATGRADERVLAQWASLMWSTAHGFATLLLDGPLLAKLPPGLDVDRHIEDVIGLMNDLVLAGAARLGLVLDAR